LQVIASPRLRVRQRALDRVELTALSASFLGMPSTAKAVIGAIAGQDAVITALGTRPWRYTTVSSSGIVNIIEACIHIECDA